MDTISNVLAQRYASADMKTIWSSRGRFILERDFWIAVMKAQRDLGLAIPAEAIAAYEKVKDQVDLEAIQERERVTLHDVKARIEEFCELAGHEHIHKGMTSRDLTENVEQLQVLRALELVRTKCAAALITLARRAEEYGDLVIAGRTHNVAAQPTTMGKRLAMFGQEMQEAFRGLENLVEVYPVRGLKGAVGTQLDQLTLFGGDEEKVGQLEERVVHYLGFKRTLVNVGQVYPRSLDFEVVSRLYQFSAGASSLAKTLRLMAGHELASEGFQKGQVGSSAMPHKMNSRSCERINGFHVILGGYLSMTAALAGDQWNEGDVSCSVVRRVALPDAFFAIDGLLETLLTVLNQMEAFSSVIEVENGRYFPFLATTTFLMEAVKRGAGREAAHEAIKEHAVAAVGALRRGEITRNDLVDRLAGDARVGLSSEELQAFLADRSRFLCSAREQVAAFVASAGEIAARYPAAAVVKPGRIL
jgi:adenylosuccinate lyase